MSSSASSMRSPAALRAAIRLSRPDQVLLILVVYAVGCAAGAHLSGEVPATGDALLVGLTLGFVAVSVHAANEYADVETDALTVRTRFSGGSGALLDHGLPAALAARVAQISGVAAIATLGAGWLSGRIPGTVAALLVLCLVAGWAYSVGPWPFSRHGWGEVVNALLGGLLLPTIGALMAAASLAAALLAFLPFTLLVFVNLLETQWADRTADRAAGKHTLASRLSPVRFDCSAAPRRPPRT
ncbi:prenyltransferase [Nocardioides sambongensis]|uniref:prenyltransferase n=1 Tax=Nocardioides sambongensis TaxID=2589074 RepID=UPI0018C8883F|nr:prenyltransferase [Nocardioides sambongensis]